MDCVPILVLGRVRGWLLRIWCRKSGPFSSKWVLTVLGKLSTKAYGGVETHIRLIATVSDQNVGPP
jgi:hypothetical protein